MKRFNLFLILALTSLVSIQKTTCSAQQPKPRVSIISSVFKGDEFIEGFMEDIVQQSIFNECELILINANSPHNEEPVIKKYMANYPNIIYVKLCKDPGVYPVWNMGIRMASADLVTNANIDDRRNPVSLEIEAQALEADPLVDLVYGDFLVTYNANETFTHNNNAFSTLVPEFKPELIYWCLPGPQPMWRKSMHKKYGFFSNDFSSAGDHEMWCRAVSKGAQFKKIPDFLTGIFYENPKGLSTDQDEAKVIKRNAAITQITEMYKSLWQTPQKVWSILICTLDERAEAFNKLHQKLKNQILNAGLEDKVEVLFFKDNREVSVGFKRNNLIEQSSAEYICFVDDDDDIHENYVSMIYEKLLKNPDCVSLTGIITTCGQNPQFFIHSLKNETRYEWANGAYQRPPNHLNPMKRTIANQFKFPESNVGEDKFWTLKLAYSKLLQTEEVIDEPYYFYHYDDKYATSQNSN